MTGSCIPRKANNPTKDSSQKNMVEAMEGKKDEKFKGFQTRVCLCLTTHFGNTISPLLAGYNRSY